jgi:hypothetical protein
VRSSGAYGIEGFGYDWRITDCDVGGAVNDGVRFHAGGAHHLVGCNIYNVTSDGVNVSSAVGMYVSLVNCSIGACARRGLYAAGSPTETKAVLQLTNVSFTDNSTVGNGSYPHIDLVNHGRAAIIGCHFAQSLGGNRPNYLIRQSGTLGQVFFAASSWDETAAGTTPYLTAPFSNRESILGIVPEVSGTNTNVTIGGIGNGFNKLLGAASKVVLAWQGFSELAVNYLKVGNAVTGSAPVIEALGDDTDVGLDLIAKGTAFGRLRGTNGTALIWQSFNPSTVNYLKVGGQTTGNGPTVEAAGLDTNIDLRLVPKGTGAVRFGTHTVNADAAITGYVTIKTSDGTTRKLAVIA